MSFLAPNLIGHATAFGANSATTPGFDTTGATLLVLCLAAANVTFATTTITDTYNNTWLLAVSHNGNSQSSTIIYCLNPTVGANHTFTVTKTSGNQVLDVQAWGGGSFIYDSLTTFATTSGAQSLLVSTINAPLSSLIVTNLALAGTVTALVVSGGYQISDSTGFSGSIEGGASAYFYSAAGGTINPTWSWTTSQKATASVAGFIFPSGVQLPVLTPIYTEDFYNRLPADPLNPANWSPDVNRVSSPSTVGNMQTAADGPADAVVCDGSLSDYTNSSPDYFASYWSGNAPADCFIRVAVDETQDTGAAILWYRAVENNAGIDGDAGGHSYLASYDFLGISTISIALLRQPTGTLHVVHGIPAASGDILTVAVVGSTHYLMHNGNLIFAYTDSTYSMGGVGSTAIGFTNYEDNTSIQYPKVEIGSAVFSWYPLDCRDYSSFPLTPVIVQGSGIYALDTNSDNSKLPPTDSRKVKPTDDRVSEIIPENSRNNPNPNA